MTEETETQFIERHWSEAKPGSQLHGLPDKIKAADADARKTLARMENIVHAVERSGRSNLTEDETERYDAAMAEYKAQTELLEDLRNMESELNRNLGGRYAARNVPFGNGVDSGPNSGPNPWNAARSSRPGEDLRSIARSCVERAPALSDRARETLTRSLEQPTDDNTTDLAAWATAVSDPDYLRAFAKVATDPNVAVVSMTDPERAAFHRVGQVQRAMSLTGSSGGYMVPLALDPAVIVDDSGAADPMRRLATVKQITTEKWRGVSSAAIAASWDDEAAEVSDDAPTLAQPEVIPQRLTAFVPFSIEVGMDAMDFAEQMAELIAEGFAIAEGTGFWTGAGTSSNQPYGIITRLDATTTAEVVVTTDGGLAIDDVYKVWDALPARARRAKGLAWASHNTTWSKVRRFGEGATGTNSAFWTDLGGGLPPQLLGAPVHEASGFTGFSGSTGAANLMVVGDFKRYVIADRVGSTMELVPHLFSTSNPGRPTGQRGWFAYKRTGGDVVTTSQLKLLQNQ